MSVFLAVQAYLKPCHFYLVLLGLSQGLLILARPIFIFIPLLFIGYIAYSKEILVKSFIVLILSTLFVVYPWMKYSKSQTNSWSLVNSGPGFALMMEIIGNNSFLLDEYQKDRQLFSSNQFDKQSMLKEIRVSLARARKYRNHYEEYFALERLKYINFALLTYLETWTLHPPDASYVSLCDRYLKKASYVWIRHNPLGFVRVIAANVSELILGDYQPLVYQRLSGYIYFYSMFIKNTLLILFFVSTIVLVRLHYFHILFFPTIISFYLVFIHCMMHTEPRYFIYAYTFMPMTCAYLVRYLQGNNPIKIP